MQPSIDLGDYCRCGRSDGCEAAIGSTVSADTSMTIDAEPVAPLPAAGEGPDKAKVSPNFMARVVTTARLRMAGFSSVWGRLRDARVVGQSTGVIGK